MSDINPYDLEAVQRASWDRHSGPRPPATHMDIDAAYARGRSDATRALLAQVRTLPSPVYDPREHGSASGAGWTEPFYAYCRWCGASWESHPRERRVSERHPPNGCLYALAHAAEAAPSPEEGEG